MEQKERMALDHFDRREYATARDTFETILKSLGDDTRDKANCLFNIATCHACEGNFDKALNIFDKLDTTGDTDLLYNKAACHYKMRNYNEAMQLVKQLVSLNHDQNPELFIQNSLIQDERYQKQLDSSCLLEGINLKSAIVFKRDNNNFDESRRCLNEIPSRAMTESDPIIKHNKVLYKSSCSDMESSLAELLELANYRNSNVVSLGHNIPETIDINVLLLSMQAGFKESAKNYWNTNKAKVEKQLLPEMVEYLDIQLNRDVWTEEQTYRKLDECLDNLLARINKEFKLNRIGNSNEFHDDNITLIYRQNLIDSLLIILSDLCEILWDNNQYELVRRLLNKFEFVLKNSPIWRKNLAHTLYMSDRAYEDCVKLYESLVPLDESGAEQKPSLTSIDPMVLASLCVSYVLNGQNSLAESLIEEVRNDEKDLVAMCNPSDSSSSSFSLVAGSKGLLDKSGHQNDNTANLLARATAENYPPHMTIINIVIGTLYCVKNNYEFGLMRIFKAMDPIESKLNRYTWFHAKRCLLNALDRHCKHIVYLKDDTFSSMTEFLIKCETHGVLVEPKLATSEPKHRNHRSATNLEPEPDVGGFISVGRNSVAYEARYLRSIVLQLNHD